MIFCGHRHIIITHCLTMAYAAIRYKNTRSTAMKRKRSHFLTGHIQCKQSLSPRSLELRGIFKRTDDHIFEKTLKIELSPIPQAYIFKHQIKPCISNVVRTTPFLNNIQQVIPKPNNVIVFGVNKTKGSKEIAKICYGQLCLMEENISFNNNYMI